MYFVTLVAYQRAGLFGEITGGDVQLNHGGEIAQMEWERLGQRFGCVDLGAFVVMPNHIHGIIAIRSAEFGVTHAA